MAADIQDSVDSAAVVIEAIGPLFDDDGALDRTVEAVVRDAGVELRPDAIEQVRGASVRWALTTLLEGHGRTDLAERLDEMVAAVERRWQRLFASGEIGLAPSANEGWRRLTGSRVLLLFGGDPELIATAVRSMELTGVGQLAIGGGGVNGMPDSRQVRSWVARLATGTKPRAAVRSGAAALAAAGAGCSPVVLVGAEPAAARVLPVDARVADLVSAFE